MASPDTPLSLGELISRSHAQLSEALGLPATEARLEAQVLLAGALAANRAYLIAHANEIPDAAAHARYQTWLARRLQGEPIAYILGKKEFYGLDFKVSPDVLIPRPETELLVELALARLPPNRSARILDLGTGSGALAITLAKQRPLAQVIAVDRSPAALAVARENAQRLGAANVVFLQSDWFAALEGETFDLIVSNPPYVADADPHLLEGDVRFEPAGALKGGESGLDCIRAIVMEARAHLGMDGWLLFEHGYDQGESSRALLAAAGFANACTANDLAGIPRVSYGQKPE